MSSSRSLRIGARVAEIALGLTFVLSGFPKAHALMTFARQIHYYYVLPNTSSETVAAMGTVLIEAMLAALLLCGVSGWARHALHLFVQGLLGVFTLLIFYGWIFHDLKDCGCFVGMELSPQWSIVKNVALSALGLFAWIGLAKTEAALGKPVRRWWLRMVVACLLMATVAGLGWHDMTRQRIAPVSEERGPLGSIVFDTEDGRHIDLGKGDYLVAFLSMDCEHCQAAAPELNSLTMFPDVWPMVAVCLEENAGDMDAFKAMALPTYPMYNLGNKAGMFFELLNREDTLGVCLSRNGFVVAKWDGKAPSYGELVEAMNKAPARPGPEPIENK